MIVPAKITIVSPCLRATGAPFVKTSSKRIPRVPRTKTIPADIAKNRPSVVLVMLVFMWVAFLWG
jgi:hypothetical protein